jgi:protein-ribulosamine 3-kinase
MEIFPLAEAASPEAAVALILGNSARIVERTPVGGGCINRAERLRLGDGTLLFLKSQGARGAQALPSLFVREAEGLAALAAAAEGPRVPRPLAVGDGVAGDFLLMEWVQEGRRGPGFFEGFGRALAGLHRETAAAFGFANDNYIGATPQPNGWDTDFVRFFGERRLGYQIELAERRGRTDRAMVRGVRGIIERLEDLLQPLPARPALLHGDLWSGNYLVDAAGAPVIIDPAVYYGAPEADLAMTELFGGFDDPQSSTPSEDRGE